MGACRMRDVELVWRSMVQANECSCLVARAFAPLSWPTAITTRYVEACAHRVCYTKPCVCVHLWDDTPCTPLLRKYTFLTITTWYVICVLVGHKHAMIGSSRVQRRFGAGQMCGNKIPGRRGPARFVCDEIKMLPVWPCARCAAIATNCHGGICSNGTLPFLFGNAKHGQELGEYSIFQTQTKRKR